MAAKLSLTKVFHPVGGKDGDKAPDGVEALVVKARVFVGFGLTVRVDSLLPGVQLTKVMAISTNNQLRIFPTYLKMWAHLFIIKIDKTSNSLITGGGS